MKHSLSLLIGVLALATCGCTSPARAATDRVTCTIELDRTLLAADAVQRTVMKVALRAPELTRRTRVAHVSDEYGFPPMVARRSLDRATYTVFRDTLLAMPNDARGRELLQQLNLDGFLPPDDSQFAGIARVLEFVSSRERLPT